MLVEIFSLMAALGYTLSGILAMFGMKNANPNSATFISMLANMLFLWPIALLFSPLTISQEVLVLYIISAAFSPLAGRLLNYVALEKMGVSTTTSILGLQPVIVAGLATVLIGERLPATIYVAITVTVAGVVIIGRERRTPGGAKPYEKRELVFPLAAALSYSGSNITIKQGLKIQNLPFLASAVTSTLSAAYMLALLAVTRRLRQIRVTRSTLLIFILSGFVNSLAWIANFEALSIGEASIVSTILGAQPLIAIVLGYLLLRKTEAITKGKVAGALLVVAGVATISILR